MISEVTRLGGLPGLPGRVTLSAGVTALSPKVRFSLYSTNSHRFRESQCYRLESLICRFKTLISTIFRADHSIAFLISILCSRRSKMIGKERKIRLENIEYIIVGRADAIL